MYRFDENQQLDELSIKHPPCAYLIMDGQWGSCGKGLLSGKLALEKKPDLCICNFGPNAGHTFVFEDGRSIITQQLPIGLVHPEALLMIAPGAIIDPDILSKEIEKYDGEFNISKRLMIHERTALITPQDKINEEKLTKIASTKKGVGSAQAKKIMRVGENGEPLIAKDSKQIQELATIVTDQQYRKILLNCPLIQIESAQGLELSINHGSHYPYCTSRDVTPEAILNDCGVPSRFLQEKYVVVRTFPIRVGNELNAQGEEIGSSGPVYSDMQELSWQDISNKINEEVLEKTTVTKKIRRVFSWSDQQFSQMLARVAPAKIFLNYCNYLNEDAKTPELLEEDSKKFIDKVKEECSKYDSELTYLGFGPQIDHVFNTQKDLILNKRNKL